MNSAWPPKREPWAKITPEQFGSVISTSARILYERPRTLTATLSGTGDGARIVDVPLAGRFFGGPLRGEDLQGGAVVERQHQVLLRLLEPGLDQRLELLGILLGQVLRLGAVRVHVVELPLVLVEVALV